MCHADGSPCVSPVHPALPKGYRWVPDVFTGHPRMTIDFGHDMDTVVDVRYEVFVFADGEPNVSREATCDDDPAKVYPDCRPHDCAEFAYFLTRYARLKGLTRGRRDLHRALGQLRRDAATLFSQACQAAREAQERRREAGVAAIGEDWK